jgi:DNA-binding CsgD family transcriptional regulator
MSLKNKKIEEEIEVEIKVEETTSTTLDKLITKKVISTQVRETVKRRKNLSGINDDSKRKNRSDSYQWILLETTFSHEMLDSFSNEDSIFYKLNPFHYDERLLDLEDQLKKRFWEIVEMMLTSRQQNVIKLSADGYTQMEIAKLLDVNQSSITKSIHGNVDYKGNGRRNYGGSKRKLLKILETDPQIQEIIQKMNEIREYRW